MIGKIDLEGLDGYRAFLSGYSSEVLELTDNCLQKASTLQEQWHDGHVDEVIAELMQLKGCMNNFSQSCERYCKILQEMIEKYRIYLSGRFGND